MGHQFNSISDAQLQAKLAAAGFPVLPITATTRPLLMKKLQSGLASKNCQETPKYYTVVDRVYSMSDVELQNALVEFGYPVMPVTATTRKVLLKKLISIYDGTSTARKTTARNKEFCFYSSTLSPDYKFAPNLSSLKSTATEDETNIFRIDKTTTTNTEFKPAFEPEIKPYSNARYDDTDKKNMDDYDKTIVNMFQAFSSQQDKRFREMLTNIHTTRQEMFQNLSNQQEIRFRELLTDLNCASRQEIYQSVSIQQEKCFEKLLTSLNTASQKLFQELSNQQEKRFKDLVTHLQSTREDMYQLVHDQREKQFEELLSNFHHIKDEKEKLSNTIDNLSSKYDEVLHRLQQTDVEKRDSEVYIQILQKKLEILERKLTSTTLKIRNVRELNRRELETKEDLCKFVIKLGKSLGIHIEMVHIRDVYRESSVSIIVDFTTAIMKEGLHLALTKTQEKSENTTPPASFLLLSIFILISSFYLLSLFLIYF